MVRVLRARRRATRVTPPVVHDPVVKKFPAAALTNDIAM
jgi:hypothetical protein